MHRKGSDVFAPRESYKLIRKRCIIYPFSPKHSMVKTLERPPLSGTAKAFYAEDPRFTPWTL